MGQSREARQRRQPQEACAAGESLHAVEVHICYVAKPVPWEVKMSTECASHSEPEKAHDTTRLVSERRDSVDRCLRMMF
eukprot:35556-Eustigmatos_ZCMA.PRE.1